MQINDIKPFAKQIDLVVKVLNKNEIREVQSKADGSNHKVTEAVIGDASGICLLTLWDDSINKIEVGQVYAIKNAYTNLFQRKIRLNIGRYGTIEVSTDKVDEIKEDNNVSDKEQAFVPRPMGGGGGFRGGGDRGGQGGFGGGGRRDFGGRDNDRGGRGGRRDDFSGNDEEY